MNHYNNSKQQQEQVPPSKEEIQEKLDIISLANETSVLMALLCEKLKLTPQTTTHQQFVEAFTDVQKKRLDAEKYMQEQFMLSNNPKTRKKREKKEGEAEIMELNPVDEL